MPRRAAFLLALSVSACRPAHHAPPVVSLADDRPEPEVAGETPAVVGLEPVDGDHDPCVDFYQYACAPWLAEHPLPAGLPVWNRSFSVAEGRVQARLRELLGELTRAPEQTALGTFWRTCLDEPGRVAAGLGPIEPMLTAIDELQPRDLPALLGTLHAHGVPALFWLRRPEPNASTLAISLGTAGLGPAAAYAKSAPRLGVYGEHVAEMFRLADLDEPQRRAAAVLALEAKLADLQSTLAELTAAQTRPPEPRPFAALRKETRAFAWDRYFAALGQPEPAQVLLPAGRFEKLTALVKRTDIAVLRDYLRWHLLHHAATILPPVFAAEHNRMFDPEAAVAGREADCVQHTEREFGPELGRAYIERHVAPADRTRLRALVERMRAQLRGDVERAPWIEAPARQAILAYLDGLTIAVAEPSPAAAPPPTTTGEFQAAALALRKARVAAQLAGTAARARPATSVNGEMSPGKVTLFAGILQPPFYSPDLPEPVLLGAIGQIIAHEMGHVLDPEGVVQEIGLTPSPAYETRLQCVRDSYARAEVAPGIHVDGNFVAKESFADNVGLRIAHALARAGGPAAERQFFIAWGQLLCTHYTPEMLEMAAQFDVAPAPLRVNQPLALFPAFAAAFECAEGTPMRPRDACSPW